MILFAVVVILIFFSGIVALIISLRILTARKIRAKDKSPRPTIAFIHPFALAGGGGERVLWTAIRTIQKRLPGHRIVIYARWQVTSDPKSIDEALSIARKNARIHFGLDISGTHVEVVDICDLVNLVEPARYPRLTLAMQSIGMIVLGARAFLRRPALIVIDTANLAFSLMVPRLLGAYTISYVHYPTISSDMLSSVAKRETAVHNDARTAASAKRTAIKLVYYRCFAAFYALSAKFISHAVANSSWTAGHLRHIWGYDVDVLFPPCNVYGEENKEDMSRYAEEGRQPGLVVSVGQFRPEKRHDEQIEIIRKVLDRSNSEFPTVKLVMLGGARDVKDVHRAETVKLCAEQEQLPVSVHIDASVEELRNWLGKGMIGLHTMRHEHFGISVVELMQAGLIVVAHRSGGVASDIVKHGVNGFLANDIGEFAQAIRDILQMSTERRQQIRALATRHCRKFSQSEFERGFLRCVHRAVDVCALNKY